MCQSLPRCAAPLPPCWPVQKLRSICTFTVVCVLLQLDILLAEQLNASMNSLKCH